MFGFNPLYTAVLGLMGGPNPALSLDFLASNTLNPAVVTFSRASNATMFDSAGNLVWAPHNLCPMTEDFTHVSWVVSRGTITTGVSDPNGGTAAVTLTGTDTLAQLQAAPSLAVSGQQYTVSMYLRRRTGTGQVYIRSVENVNTPITITSSWARYSLTATATGTALRIGFSFQEIGDEVDCAFPMAENYSAAIPSVYVRNTTVGAYYGPRFDYNPATLQPRGLLNETSRTNGVSVSGAFSVATGVASVAQNATDVFGAANAAWTVTESLTAGIQLANSNSATLTATTNAFSVFVKAGTATRCQLATSVGFGSEYANFSLVGDGSVLVQNASNNAVIQKCANGWFRISMAYTTLAATNTLFVAHINSDTATRLPSYTGTGLTLQVCQAQMEAGNFATSLIPTFGTAATRAADVADLVSDPPWNQAGMTYCAQFERQGLPVPSSAEATSSMYYFGDTTDWVNHVFGFGTPSQARCDLGGGGVVQSQTGYNGVPAFVVSKMATRFAPNDVASYYNGLAGTVDSAVVMPAALGTSRKSIGRANSASAQQMHGWLRGIQIYTQALDNATLQALTT